MSNSKQSFKTIFVPDIEQGGGAIKQNTKHSVLDILLKLAKANGYNDQNNIRNWDAETFIPQTNVSMLVAYAVQNEKFLEGKEEFAKLLSKVGVPLSAVTNENMKMLMEKLSPSDGDTFYTPSNSPQPSSPQPTPRITPSSAPIQQPNHPSSSLIAKQTVTKRILRKRKPKAVNSESQPKTKKVRVLVSLNNGKRKRKNVIDISNKRPRYQQLNDSDDND